MSSKKVIFEWNHRGVARRVFPHPAPPPPHWCWGNPDEILQSIMVKMESPEDADDMACISPEPSLEPKQGQFAVDEITTEKSRVLDYHHGQHDYTKKFFVNPFYQNRKTTSSENQENMSVDNVTSEERKGDASLPFGDSLTEPAPNAPRRNVKIEGVRSSTSAQKVGTKRKIAASSDNSSDCLIGQKLSKSRVGVSSRSYAKPTTKSHNVNENSEDTDAGKFVPETQTIKLETEVVNSKNLTNKKAQVVIKEEIVVDVDPYCLLNIEEELRKMEEASSDDED